MAGEHRGHSILMLNRVPIRLIPLAVVSAFTIAGLSCGSAPDAPEYDNPIIPDDPSYVPPQTTILSGPEEGAVVDTHIVTFTWRGNQDDMDFMYLKPDSTWSEFSTDTSVTFRYLDEGDYLFEVSGRYSSLIEEDIPASRTYTINDIHGPALWLYPRYQQVDVGSEFSVEVMLEEVENVFAVKAVLEFDPTVLQVSNVEVYEDSRSLLKANGGTVIPFSSYDNTAGSVVIEAATATGGPAGVDGTGSLGIITFSSGSAGDNSITITPGSQLRNPENGSIAITEKVGAYVEVAQ